MAKFILDEITLEIRPQPRPHNKYEQNPHSNSDDDTSTIKSVIESGGQSGEMFHVISVLTNSNVLPFESWLEKSTTTWVSLRNTSVTKIYDLEWHEGFIQVRSIVDVATLENSVWVRKQSIKWIYGG